MSQEPQLTPDTFLHTTHSSSQPKQPPVIIYFVSGNPGLISYYHPFLSLLSSKLSSQRDTFQIYGHSLAGFEVGTDNAKTDQSLFDVEEQICFVQRKLADFVNDQNQVGGEAQSHNLRPKVILIGHSVGTYMAMEVMRRHSENVKSGASSSGFDIVGGVLLFPTVMDIAKSPSGQKLTKLLSFIPQLALVVGLFVNVLTLLLPDIILRSCIRLVMSSPSENAVDTTFAFLKSKRGVRQALYMAADEMRTITSDKWSDDIWGISSTTAEPLTKLFFYFGRNDHWVAEQTRDEIIELRGRMKKGPTMLVCDDGLPHAFCLGHSDVMATKVVDMIKDIVLDS